MFRAELTVFSGACWRGSKPRMRGNKRERWAQHKMRRIEVMMENDQKERELHVYKIGALIMPWDQHLIIISISSSFYLRNNVRSSPAE